MIQRLLVRLLVGKVEGRLTELEGWRTRLGAVVTILSSLAVILASLVCVGNLLLANDWGSHLEEMKACLTPAAAACAAIGVAVSQMGNRRATAKLHDVVVAQAAPGAKP